MGNVKNNKTPEILSPAGNFEKLKFAVEYGADAVYCSGSDYGMRAYAGNFSDTELSAGAEYCRAKNKKIYVTVNIFPRNSDIPGIEKHVSFLKELNVNGIIVSDPGVFSIVKKTAPKIPIHVSVQANSLNYAGVEAWRDMGAGRIVLARELTFSEIKEIKKMAEGIELELFVHGAVCISMSGRCLLSDYLAGRSANRGECAQSCRWKYSLCEEKRPGEYMPVEQDKRGSYILNAKDLNLSARLGELMDAGIDSFKIEGRMKSVHYTAVTAAIYRKIADMHLKGEVPGRSLFNELNNISHREYTEGFYFDENNVHQNYKSSDYVSDYRYLGHVIKKHGDYFEITVKHSFKLGSEINVFNSDAESFNIRVISLLDKEKTEQSYAKQNEEYLVKFETDKIEKIKVFSILRVCQKEPKKA